MNNLQKRRNVILVQVALSLRACDFVRPSLLIIPKCFLPIHRCFEAFSFPSPPLLPLFIFQPVAITFSAATVYWSLRRHWRHGLCCFYSPRRRLPPLAPPPPPPLTYTEPCGRACYVQVLSSRALILLAEIINLALPQPQIFGSHNNLRTCTRDFLSWNTLAYTVQLLIFLWQNWTKENRV